MNTPSLVVPAAPRRVTVAAPATRLDVSLPPQATVAELVPQLIRMAGATKQPSTGWTMGRLGAEPFDDSSTVASAGIRDGEVLYLYPQDGQPLPLLFDDITEAVAEAVTRGPRCWGPAHTRRIGLTAHLIAFAVLGSLVSLAWPAQGGLLSAGLLFLGAFLGRGPRDIAAGVMVAAAGLPGFALAGAQLVAGSGEGGWAAPQVTAGCAAALIYSLIAAVIIVDGRIWFSGAVLAAGAGCLTAVVPAATGAPAAYSATALVAVALLGAAALPSIALRLSRVPLPRPPVDTSALRADERPVAGAEVAGSAVTASFTLTSLVAGLTGLLLGGVAVVMSAAPEWSLALTVLSGSALMLRSRAYTNAGQRMTLLIGGGLVLAGVGAWLLLESGPMARVVVFGAMFVAAIACLARAMRSLIPPSPYWSRLLDILEVVVLVSLLPVALAVLDIYSLARAVSG